MLKHFMKPNILEVGLDEVARGCLAGRVYAAAVIWNPYLNSNFKSQIPDIDDSKKLTAKSRAKYRHFIEKYAVDFGIGWVDEKEIDKINIRNASMKAMHIALDNLSFNVDHIIVDGNYFADYKNIPNTCVVKGDSKYYSIAAASILAKVYRDEYLNDLMDKEPDLEKYGWRTNNSYGAKKHFDAIEKYGITKYHRQTFGICKKYATCPDAISKNKITKNKKIERKRKYSSSSIDKESIENDDVELKKKR